MNEVYHVKYAVYWPGVIVTAVLLVIGTVALILWKRQRGRPQKPDL